MFEHCLTIFKTLIPNLFLIVIIFIIIVRLINHEQTASASSVLPLFSIIRLLTDDNKQSMVSLRLAYALIDKN